MAEPDHIDTESWGRYLAHEMPETWPYDPVNGLLVGSEDWLRNGREMTSEDLGLPLGQWAIEWLRDTYGPCQRWEAFLA